MMYIFGIYAFMRKVLAFANYGGIIYVWPNVHRLTSLTVNGDVFF